MVEGVRDGGNLEIEEQEEFVIEGLAHEISANVIPKPNRRHESCLLLKRENNIAAKSRQQE